ncbi:M20/M25/M40 family metallo-hydrolase [Kordia sp. YSTF-M3]|uniref:M20/M25/M40 family metallo-hydrolase n=1 Tax=Kordia aestuariivivens TaxID=2759037 RepID=A0ABR7Q6M6_9FLAO|nr:M20/M25/M40 family metallo-hydrolase [Kordia aestuariivivens]MBC8754138.1 M20/M25/M40 family metallo-hydrolase [Kordia aestuariivivens]
MFTKPLFGILFLVLVCSCKTERTVENNIKPDIEVLADDLLKGRATGTQGEITAALYIAERFKSMGILPKGTNKYLQEFTFTPKTDPHAETVYIENSEKGTITGRNVLGYIDNKAETTIVIGAHYDHLGMGQDGSLHRGEPMVHNGADDNASGVAVMLHLADRLKEGNKNNNYLFIAFSGEEMGLLGSNYFVKNPTIDLTKVNYMINMDMVGRLKKNKKLAIYGVGTSPIWQETVVKANSKHTFDFKLSESGVGPSDHTSFYLQDIPVLHLFTGQHVDYHKPSDDFEKLNYEGMLQISNYIYRIISEVNSKGKIEFTKTVNESEDTPRFKVTLGVIPDYLFDGKGMRIDGISENRPAQKAGLQKGDVVIQLGEHEVTDMKTYMRALSKFENGNKTTVKVNRNGKTIEAEITFFDKKKK